MVPRRFEFAPSLASYQEAMRLGGQSLTPRSLHVFNLVGGPVYAGLIAAGAGALAWLVGHHLGATSRIGVPAAMALVGVLFIWHQNWAFKAVTKTAIKTSMQATRQVIQFDRDGVTYEAGGARWQTPWSLVDDIQVGKKALLVFVGGIGFSVPKASIGEEGEVEALAAELKALLHDA